jgi:hypothetical protein
MRKLCRGIYGLVTGCVLLGWSAPCEAAFPWSRKPTTETVAQNSYYPPAANSVPADEPMPVGPVSSEGPVEGACGGDFDPGYCNGIGCFGCCDAGFYNCDCNGSYKFPVPPLYTYHWPGMYSQQLMTDYHSPWRFPPLKPYVDEPPVEEIRGQTVQYQPQAMPYVAWQGPVASQPAVQAWQPTAAAYQPMWVMGPGNVPYMVAPQPMPYAMAAPAAPVTPASAIPAPIKSRSVEPLSAKLQRQYAQ